MLLILISEKALSKVDVQEGGPKKDRTLKKPNMENVILIDKSKVEFKEKKPSFNFIVDPIEIPKGLRLSNFNDIELNKDVKNKEDKVSTDFMASDNTWTDFKMICKDKKEHNKCSDEELLRFREGLPRNVRLSESVSSSSLFKRNTEFCDGTTRAIGPCLDINCSGKNKEGKRIFRVFNTLFEMKNHGGNDKLHNLDQG